MRPPRESFNLSDRGAVTPRRVTVRNVLESRYTPGNRPVVWDKRTAGLERIQTSEGEVISLASNGGQSTPAPGWTLLLTNQVDDAFEWTLYGIASA